MLPIATQQKGYETKKITLQIIIIAIMENFYLKEAVIRRS